MEIRPPGSRYWLTAESRPQAPFTQGQTIGSDVEIIDEIWQKPRAAPLVVHTSMVGEESWVQKELGESAPEDRGPRMSHS